jgi:hypothetical protein
MEVLIKCLKFIISVSYNLNRLTFPIRILTFLKISMFSRKIVSELSKLELVFPGYERRPINATALQKSAMGTFPLFLVLLYMTILVQQSRMELIIHTYYFAHVHILANGP